MSKLARGNGWNYDKNSALYDEIVALIDGGANDPELGKCKAALERLQADGNAYSNQGYDVRASAHSAILLNRAWKNPGHREARDEIIALIEGGATDPDLHKRRVGLELFHRFGETYPNQGADVLSSAREVIERNTPESASQPIR